MLEALIEDYRAKYGDPEYAYFKTQAIWSKQRLRPGEHITIIGDGIPVSRAKYDANEPESRRLQGEAFMGRHPASYWKYSRKMVRPGWREILIKEIESAPDPQSCHGSDGVLK